MNFPIWWAFCERPENDGSADDGPGTHWGWTYPTWAGARRYAGFADVSIVTFDAINQTAAGQLAQGYFWNRLGGRQMASGSDVCVIDWAWTSGGAIVEIQSMLGVSPDNIVGPETIKAINSHPSFVVDCSTWRYDYYVSLGLAVEFPGLLTRSIACKTLALTLVKA